MVIGSISFTSTRQTPINQLNTNSFLNNDLVNEANSSVASASQKAVGQLPVASDKSFSIDTWTSTFYVDPTSGQLYVAGGAAYAAGLGVDNLSLSYLQSFTPVIKSGDKAQPFIDPIDYVCGSIIDADGKLWMSGYNNLGTLGNGYIGGNQYTFEMVTLGLPSDYKAVKVVRGVNNTNTIVMLDNGDIYGAGNYYALGLSSTGGYKLVDGQIVEGGHLYHTFQKLNGITDPEVGLEMPFDPSQIVDFKIGEYHINYLLDDRTLWRCNGAGYAQIATDVVHFDAEYGSLVHYMTSNGDVYYCQNNTGVIKILSKTDDSVPSYDGEIKEVHSTTEGWGYLTTDGDVYYSPNSWSAVDKEGNNNLVKIAQDVVYFDMSAWSFNRIFGAITRDGQFKLWGNDSRGQLGNGDNAGNTPGWDNANPSIDAFLSEASTPSTSTTDGKDVVIPGVGTDGKADPANPIIPTLASPAPAIVRNGDAGANYNEVVYGGYFGFNYTNLWKSDWNTSGHYITLNITDWTGEIIGREIVINKDNLIVTDKDATPLPKAAGTYSYTTRLMDKDGNLVGTQKVEVKVVAKEQTLSETLIKAALGDLTSDKAIGTTKDDLSNRVLSALQSDASHAIFGGELVAYGTDRLTAEKFENANLTASNLTVTLTNKVAEGETATNLTFIGQNMTENHVLTIGVKSISGYVFENVVIEFTATGLEEDPEDPEQPILPEYTPVLKAGSIKFTGGTLGEGKSTQIGFYNGEQYQIIIDDAKLLENIGDYSIEIVISGNGHNGHFNYFNDSAATKWAEMPKAPGAYTVQATLSLGTEGVVSTITSTLSIKETTAKIQTAGTDTAIDALLAENTIFDREGQEGVVKHITDLLNEEGFIAANAFFGEGFKFYNSNTLEEIELTNDMFEFRFYDSRQKEVDEIFGTGTHYVRITFLGTEGYAESTTGFIDFEVKQRAVLTSTAQFITGEVKQNTITFGNGGAQYSLSLSGVSSFDADYYTVKVVITGPNDFEKQFDLADMDWSLMPKNAGEYVVTVKLADSRDNYTTKGNATTLTIAKQTVSIDYSADKPVNQTVDFTNKDLRAEIISTYTNGVIVKQGDNQITELYSLNANGNFDKVAISAASYKVTVTNTKTNAVVTGQVKDSGEYTVVVSLNESNYEVSAQTFTFTIAESTSSFNYRGLTSCSSFNISIDSNNSSSQNSSLITFTYTNGETLSLNNPLSDGGFNRDATTGSTSLFDAKFYGLFIRIKGLEIKDFLDAGHNFGDLSLDDINNKADNELFDLLRLEDIIKIENEVLKVIEINGNGEFGNVSHSGSTITLVFIPKDDYKTQFSQITHTVEVQIEAATIDTDGFLSDLEFDYTPEGNEILNNSQSHDLQAKLRAEVGSINALFNFGYEVTYNGTELDEELGSLKEDSGMDKFNTYTLKQLPAGVNADFVEYVLVLKASSSTVTNYVIKPITVKITYNKSTDINLEFTADDSYTYSGEEQTIGGTLVAKTAKGDTITYTNGNTVEGFTFTEIPYQYGVNSTEFNSKGFAKIPVNLTGSRNYASVNYDDTNSIVTIDIAKKVIGTLMDYDKLQNYQGKASSTTTTVELTKEEYVTITGLDVADFEISFEIKTLANSEWTAATEFSYDNIAEFLATQIHIMVAASNNYTNYISAPIIFDADNNWLAFDGDFTVEDTFLYEGFVYNQSNILDRIVEIRNGEGEELKVTNYKNAIEYSFYINGEWVKSNDLVFTSLNGTAEDDNTIGLLKIKVSYVNAEQFGTTNALVGEFELRVEKTEVNIEVEAYNGLQSVKYVNQDFEHSLNELVPTFKYNTSDVADLEYSYSLAAGTGVEIGRTGKTATFKGFPTSNVEGTGNIGFTMSISSEGNDNLAPVSRIVTVYVNKASLTDENLDHNLDTLGDFFVNGSFQELTNGELKVVFDGEELPFTLSGCLEYDGSNNLGFTYLNEEGIFKFTMVVGASDKTNIKTYNVVLDNIKKGQIEVNESAKDYVYNGDWQNIEFKDTDLIFKGITNDVDMSLFPSYTITGDYLNDGSMFDADNLRVNQLPLVGNTFKFTVTSEENENFEATTGEITITMVRASSTVDFDTDYEFAYNGTEQTINSTHVTADAGAGVNTSSLTLKVYLQTHDSSDVNINTYEAITSYYNDGREQFTFTNAGEYKIVVIYGDSAPHSRNVAGCYLDDITITVNKINYEDYTSEYTVTFNGDEQVITLDDFHEEEDTFTLDNFDSIFIGTDSIKVLNAGSGTVQVTYAETANYLEQTITVTVVVEKASVNIDDFQDSLAEVTGQFVSTSTEMWFNANNIFANVDFFDNENVTFSVADITDAGFKVMGSDACQFSINKVPTTKTGTDDKGSYGTLIVKVNFAGNDNVNSEEEFEIEIKIYKANKTIDKTNVETELVYNSQGAELDMSNVTCTGNETVTANITFNGQSVDGFDLVGTYKVTLVSEETQNYNATSSDEFEVVVVKADLEYTFDINEYTYNGLEQELTTIATLKDGISEEDMTTSEGIQITYTNNKFTNAGTYTVNIQIVDTLGRYNEVNETIDITIAKLKEDTSIDKENPEITFTPQKDETMVIYGLVPGAAYNIRLIKEGTSTPEDLNRVIATAEGTITLTKEQFANLKTFTIALTDSPNTEQGPVVDFDIADIETMLQITVTVYIKGEEIAVVTMIPGKQTVEEFINSISKEHNISFGDYRWFSDDQQLGSVKGDQKLSLNISLYAFEYEEFPLYMVLLCSGAVLAGCGLAGLLVMNSKKKSYKKLLRKYEV